LGDVSTEQVSSALVLVVDDDDMGRAMCGTALRGAGMDVVEADSVDAALAYLARAEPDAVVLDVMLPPKSGFDVLEYIRATRKNPYMPVLVLTALHDGKSLSRAYDLGATDFASKPIHPLQLSQRLRFLLRNFETQRRLNESQARLELAQSTARLGVFEFDSQTGQLSLHRTAKVLLGRAEDSAQISIAELTERIPKDERERVRSAWRAASGGGALDIIHRLIGWDERERFVECHTVALPERPSRSLGTIQDVTERQQTRAQLTYLAQHDALTGVLARSTFVDRANAAFGAQPAGTEVAIALIDLDRFAAFNDAYGNAAGDDVLRTMARRLEQAPQERRLITRIAADQFALLCPLPAAAPDAVARLGRSIQQLISQPMEISKQSLFFTCSVGVALFPGDGSDADSLLLHAQAAVKEAKLVGSNQVRRFTAALSAQGVLRRKLEPELRAAIEKRSLEIHYQPKLELSTGRCHSAEALVRLRLRDGTLCPPLQFLSLCEELGLMVQLDGVVLDLACAQAQRWMARDFGPIRIAVNLSHESFWDPGLVDRVRAAVAFAPSAACPLDLELTETIVVGDPALAKQRLLALRELGVRIALDDFGTGHSALAHLRHLPLDTLKIDRAFMAGLPDEPSDVAIARAIIALAKSLQLEIVAEGVERSAQVDFIRNEGGHSVQGYTIAKPMPAADAERFFSQPFRARTAPIKTR
jgi:diguanylate cyclase (GGDEF)-like protein